MTDRTPDQPRLGAVVPPGPPRVAARVLLVGPWPRRDLGPLRAACVVLDPPAAGVLPAGADWLLVRAAARGAATVQGLLRRLSPSSPALRVAVVDPEGHWPAWAPCDVYMAGDADAQEVLAALWLVGRGFSVTRGTTPPPRFAGAGPALTERESELLQALCAGLGNDQIARQFRITRSTVEFHLTNIFRKLGVTSRTEAVVRALQLDPARTMAGAS